MKKPHPNSLKTHCPQGHPYNKENTYISQEGYRHCKTCLDERNKKHYKPVGRKVIGVLAGSEQEFRAFVDEIARNCKIVRVKSPHRVEVGRSYEYKYLRSASATLGLTKLCKIRIIGTFWDKAHLNKDLQYLLEVADNVLKRNIQMETVK